MHRKTTYSLPLEEIEKKIQIKNTDKIKTWLVSHKIDRCFACGTELTIIKEITATNDNIKLIQITCPNCASIRFLDDRVILGTIDKRP
jgi:DNA-directed RNA polymerase subunit RPC12/RpoP